jgi:glyoxylase-like metal-dependent hydrolase (beta-lactamase superfamily II)
VPAAVNLVNVGYDSANYYLLGPDDARLLVDVGMPGTLPRLMAILRRKDVPLASIRHLLVTHYHPDHAGIAQELKRRGVGLIVLETQRAAIPRLRGYLKPGSGYLEITLDDNLDLTFEGSRAFLRGRGIDGEIVGTPGHSDDSVSLVLDGGTAFTGDLPDPALAEDANRAALGRSWGRLRALGVTRLCPGHGPARPPPDRPG